jgi:uncharacterized protein YegP (UPF0339 family)
MAAEFEITKDHKGEFRFKLQADNNETIAVSEGYTSKENCKNGIAAVKKVAPSAPINDRT